MVHQNRKSKTFHVMIAGEINLSIVVSMVNQKSHIIRTNLVGISTNAEQVSISKALQTRKKDRLSVIYNIKALLSDSHYNAITRDRDIPRKR